MQFNEAVTPELLKVLYDLNQIPELFPFRLVGGTAIALQIGHRKSMDIDLFSNDKADKIRLKTILQRKFLKTELFVTDQNIQAEINGVRVELYDDWSIPFRDKPVAFDGIRLASLEDLAAFKLSAITGRREKKDYIDLFFLFDKLGAETVLTQFKTYEPLLSAKSILFALTEVVEAEKNKSPMPQMLAKVTWPAIEKSMIEAAKKFISTNSF